MDSLRQQRAQTPRWQGPSDFMLASAWFPKTTFHDNLATHIYLLYNLIIHLTWSPFHSVVDILTLTCCDYTRFPQNTPSTLPS